ncbi:MULTISPECIES: hypothetical protein [unclassified Providencia]|uniref:hypothetical protein n=1 Tax=unclassified Providencia TaxID=2633465 RepID=UPI002348FEC5|nr:MULTISPECIES: hypothetical protein [unclassified Providencia]
MKLIDIFKNNSCNLDRINYVASVIIDGSRDKDGNKPVVHFHDLETSNDGKFNNSIADIILLVFIAIDRLPTRDYLWNDRVNMAHIISNYANAAINGPFAAIKGAGGPTELIEAISMDDAVIELERRIEIMNNPFKDLY